MNEPYVIAQHAIADLKTAIYLLLKNAQNGLRNVDIGRALGIYTGHIEHEGHIPRAILALMEAENVVAQNQETKIWRLVQIPEVPNAKSIA